MQYEATFRKRVLQLMSSHVLRFAESIFARVKSNEFQAKYSASTASSTNKGNVTKNFKIPFSFKLFSQLPEHLKVLINTRTTAFSPLCEHVAKVLSNHHVYQ